MVIPDFEDKDLAIIGLIILGCAILFTMWISGHYEFKDILRDIILIIGSLATGNKIKK